MYTRAFRYERADDLRAACAALRAHGEGAQVIAGGQSLLPMINVGLAAPEVWPRRGDPGGPRLRPADARAAPRRPLQEPRVTRRVQALGRHASFDSENASMIIDSPRNIGVLRTWRSIDPADIV